MAKLRRPLPALDLGYPERIRRIRRHLGMTQREFAIYVGAAVSTIGAIETGASEAGIVDIARFLDDDGVIAATWTLGLNPQHDRRASDQPAGHSAERGGNNQRLCPPSDGRTLHVGDERRHRNRRTGRPFTCMAQQNAA